jgi:nitrite reductase/ring-hydroxylating ferredoxin subunit
LTERLLCRLDEIEDGEAKGFPAPPGAFIGLLAVRQGGTVRVYLNSCPHIGVPLDWAPDEFLDATGTHIQCATHGAQFRIADGLCVKGPCMGESLEPVPSVVRDGKLFVEEG